MIEQFFIRGSNNIITLGLREDNELVTDLEPTEILIDIQGATVLRREPIGQGVTFNAGVLEINPGQFTEQELEPIKDGVRYRVRILLIAPLEPNGLVWGGNDAPQKLFFTFSTAPTPE